jgi:hypothetical protein
MISRLKIPHRFFYLLLLSCMAVGLPTSHFLMSVASIGLAINWILEGDFMNKFQRIKALRFSPVVFSLLFFVPLIWAINTSNFEQAKQFIIGSLPLLGFPIVLASIPQLNKLEWQLLKFAFLIGLTIAIASGYYIYWKEGFHSLDFDGRKMSIFISHIRLSLLLVIGLYFLYQFFELKKALAIRVVVIILGLLFINFIRMMESGTGFVALAVLLVIITLKYGYQLRNKFIQTTSIIGFTTILIGVGLYVFSLYKVQTEVRDTNDLENLDAYTHYGNPYTHDTQRKWLENGNYIWIYISFEELEKAWNERSSYDFSGKDVKGQPLYATLLRYLTSKGFRKDYDAVYQLTNQEISLIEQGITSHIPPKKGFTGRMEQIIFELVNFNLNHNPNGHSVVQRIHYFSAGLEIFKANLWLGVGTGNASSVYQSYYEYIESPLTQEKRLFAHNQLLSFFVNYGLIGGFLCIFALIYPTIISRISLTRLVFICLAIISFLVDDTLDTQAGVGLIAFFFSTFFFHPE